MHCAKGNTHFIYLEETRHEKYQAEGRGRNITKDTRTREKVWIQFVFIKYESAVLFLVKVDWGDHLDSTTDTLEFVPLPVGSNKGVSERSGPVRAEGGSSVFSMYGLQHTSYGK